LQWLAFNSFQFPATEHAMAILVIKDLPESVDLDRQAMAAITGGSKVPLRQTMLARTTSSTVWIGSGAAATSREQPANRADQRRRSTLVK
jgi:hypothetical protein